MNTHAETIRISQGAAIADVINLMLALVPSWMQITAVTPDTSTPNAYAIVWTITPPESAPDALAPAA
jgi:hypothetical protein